jgi:hypothetical protein
LATAGPTAKTALARAEKNGKKLNILDLWGDDIGYWNISAYNRGMIGLPDGGTPASEASLWRWLM